jgi:hypothetical protein
LHHTETLFTEPFRFVRRQEYTTVDLGTILKEDPETLNVYLVVQKGAYCHYIYLRIHSKPPFFGSQPRCLWFDKRMPDFLHIEDMLPWFMATIRRLPKKLQPSSLDPWAKRLLHSEPKLAAPPSGADLPWAQKPKVIFVFGPVGKIGSRSMYHFERRDISSIVRHAEVVRFDGKTRHEWNDRTFEYATTIYLLAFDEVAAARVEQQLIRGDRVHFGLTSDVLGMICQSEHAVIAINAPIDTIRRLCLKPGQDLELYSSPRAREKNYGVFRAPAGGEASEVCGPHLNPTGGS